MHDVSLPSCEPVRTASRHSSTPCHDGRDLGDRLQPVGQLVDRVERAAEQEQRHDQEPVDRRERLSGSRVAAHAVIGAANATPGQSAEQHGQRKPAIRVSVEQTSSTAATPVTVINALVACHSATPAGDLAGRERRCRGGVVACATT